MFACLLLVIVAQSPLSIQIVHNGATKPAVDVTAPPDERIAMVIDVTAPDQRIIEMPEIEAENQAPGYFSRQRPGPNLFVQVERIDVAGARQPVSIRITSSGGGQSLRRYYRSVDFHILAPPDERRARIQQFLTQYLAEIEKHANAQGEKPAQEAARLLAERARQNPALEYWDQMYIGNPPGTYRVAVEYRPRSGPLAGRTLRQLFTLRIEPGPDAFDRVLRKVR
jgi:hypothetical protein